MIDIPDGLAVIIVAIIGLGSTVIGILTSNQKDFRRRLKALERRDRLSWLYIKALIDHGHRYSSQPLPEPPEGWLDEDTSP